MRHGGGYWEKRVPDFLRVFEKWSGALQVIGPCSTEHYGIQSVVCGESGCVGGESPPALWARDRELVFTGAGNPVLRALMDVCLRG